jgi:hypothetical protein
MLYLALVRCELMYASIVCSFITPTGARKLEHVHRKILALCKNRFFTHNHVTYENLLKFTNLRTLHDRGVYLDALFIFVYSG